MASAEKREGSQVARKQARRVEEPGQVPEARWDAEPSLRQQQLVLWRRGCFPPVHLGRPPRLWAGNRWGRPGSPPRPDRRGERRGCGLGDRTTSTD